MLPLQLRVTIPIQKPQVNSIAKPALPILLLSHGHSPSNYLSSLEGYAPLAEFWAAHGFAVLQPTHLDSAFLAYEYPTGNEWWWKESPKDMSRILDNLDFIETQLSYLDFKLDRERVAVAGHSVGAWTASILLGASNTDPRDGCVWHSPEPRIKAGVVLAALGSGGEERSETGKRLLPFFDPDFSTMLTPTLVVSGDEDVMPHLTVRGSDWDADPYFRGKGAKALVRLKGGGHSLGGISGWDTAECKDENPERLAVVQRLTWAYLWSQLNPGDGTWAAACDAFRKLGSIGEVESKL